MMTTPDLTAPASLSGRPGRSGRRSWLARAAMAAAAACGLMAAGGASAQPALEPGLAAVVVPMPMDFVSVSPTLELWRWPVSPTFKYTDVMAGLPVGRVTDGVAAPSPATVFPYAIRLQGVYRAMKDGVQLLRIDIGEFSQEMRSGNRPADDARCRVWADLDGKRVIDTVFAPRGDRKTISVIGSGYTTTGDKAVNGWVACYTLKTTGTDSQGGQDPTEGGTVNQERFIRAVLDSSRYRLDDVPGQPAATQHFVEALGAGKRTISVSHKGPGDADFGTDRFLRDPAWVPKVIAGTPVVPPLSVPKLTTAYRTGWVVEQRYVAAGRQLSDGPPDMVDYASEASIDLGNALLRLQSDEHGRAPSGRFLTKARSVFVPTVPGVHTVTAWLTMQPIVDPMGNTKATSRPDGSTFLLEGSCTASLTVAGVTATLPPVWVKTGQIYPLSVEVSVDPGKHPAQLTSDCKTLEMTTRTLPIVNFTVKGPGDTLSSEPANMFVGKAG